MTHADRLLDNPIIRERVFYPRLSTLEPTLVVEVDGASLGYHVRGHYPDAGWVIYFHGNGELAGECEENIGQLFDDVGVNVCFAEYRGYGSSTGEPSLAGMLSDGEKIMDALCLPDERTAAMGRSTGSVYAIELAHRRPRLAGLILESGIASVFEQWKFKEKAERIGCSVDDLKSAVSNHLDHETKLAGYDGPTLVLHTAKDRLVPCSHADRLYAWAGGTKKYLTIFPRGDHNSILSLNSVAYMEALKCFLQEIGLSIAF